MNPGSPVVARRLHAEFASLPDARIDDMQRGAALCVASLQKLASASLSTVTAVLGKQESLVQWQHYPNDDDVFDRRTGSQYFFHTHSDQVPPSGEYGHFHLFGRADYSTPGAAGREQQCTHLLGIGVDSHGLPIRLFTTNRWVTDERWLPGPLVMALIDKFSMGARQPSLALHQWLRGMLMLFRPQIERLIAKRDIWLEHATRRRPAATVMEDRRTHIVSAEKIAFFSQLQAVYDFE